MYVLYIECTLRFCVRLHNPVACKYCMHVCMYVLHILVCIYCMYV